MTDQELNTAISLMQQLLWSERKDRERLQENGVNLIPANFYSNIPSVSEILNSYEYLEPAPPYLGGDVFDKANLRKELEALIQFSEGFNPPQDGNEESCRTFFWKNSQFSYSDAVSYFAYIRKIRPKAIFEIGSGFSSLVALEGLRLNGFGRLTCIEPYPREFISALSDENALQLHKATAQSVAPCELNAMLSDGDILFIDSTHTVKTGSDCLHIYLRLLPRINKKVYVHVHDIFLPFGMPQDWLLDSHIYWTEQYLLLALLIDNPKATVLYGSAYHKHFNADLLNQFMNDRFPSGGGSFWFEYDGRR